MCDPDAFHEEIFKLHFLLNQGRSILFCYLVWFHTRLVCVMQHVRSQTWFSVKELAIAKTVSIFELLVK